MTLKGSDLIYIFERTHTPAYSLPLGGNFHILKFFTRISTPEMRSDDDENDDDNDDD